MRFSALLLFSLVLLAGCGRSFALEDATLSGEVTAFLDEPFEVRVGDTVTFVNADITLTFPLVRSDSRCPAQATCASPGQAVVELHLNLPSGERQAVVLSLTGQTPMPHLTNPAMPLNSYLFRLIQLTPYPSLGNEPSQDDFIAMVVVEPAK